MSESFFSAGHNFLIASKWHDIKTELKRPMKKDANPSRNLSSKLGAKNPKKTCAMLYGGIEGGRERDSDAGQRKATE